MVHYITNVIKEYQDRLHKMPYVLKVLSMRFAWILRWCE